MCSGEGSCDGEMILGCLDRPRNIHKDWKEAEKAEERCCGLLPSKYNRLTSKSSWDHFQETFRTGPVECWCFLKKEGVKRITGTSPEILTTLPPRPSSLLYIILPWLHVTSWPWEGLQSIGHRRLTEGVIPSSWNETSQWCSCFGVSHTPVSKSSPMH